MSWACWCSLDRCWSDLNHRARFQLAQAVSVCLAVGRMGQVRMLSWRLKCHQVSQSLWTPMFLGVPFCRFYSSGFYKFTFQSHFMACLFPLLLLLVSSCTILFFYWHWTLCDSAATIPTGKMLKAATETQAAMDATPGVAVESPAEKNLSSIWYSGKSESWPP